MGKTEKGARLCETNSSFSESESATHCQEFQTVLLTYLEKQYLGEKLQDIVSLLIRYIYPPDICLHFNSIIIQFFLIFRSLFTYGHTFLPRPSISLYLIVICFIHYSILDYLSPNYVFRIH
jgi:hypothetical protein